MAILSVKPQRVPAHNENFMRKLLITFLLAPLVGPFLSQASDPPVPAPISTMSVEQQQVQACQQNYLDLQSAYADLLKENAMVKKQMMKMVPAVTPAPQPEPEKK